MIPDMTTGMRDYGELQQISVAFACLINGNYERTFMIKSGLKLPNPAIPIPAFEVPYAAPTATS